ncbi:protein HipA [Shigella sonnei]|nr:protein HipA [Shigella sonnei]
MQDQDSVITVRRLYNGYFGNGTVNISNNGLINNKEYSLVGVQDGSHGVVNVTDKGHWSFLGTGEAFRYIYIGDAGDGELNVSREGKGEIRQSNATLDLSQSVDNEYYCLLLAKELGLNVPDAEIIKAGRVRALAVERFDRRWNTERTVLLRLPQEDMCQTFGLPSSVKYESDGGPGIARIMAFLMGSSEALKDRYDFMKFQVFQWLIGATDGHAKNFSVFIQAGGSYRLTPFYDIISAFPVLGGTGITSAISNWQWGLTHPKAKKRQSIKFIRDIFWRQQRC